MAEQPVNLPTAIYLGVFSRAEQRVLQAIFKAIAEGGGRCVATLAMLARNSNTSKPTTRNAIAQAVAIGLLEKTERRSYCAVSLPNILSYGERLMAADSRRARVNLSRHGSDEQMFGAKRQVLHEGQGRLRSRFANERRSTTGNGRRRCFAAPENVTAPNADGPAVMF